MGWARWVARSAGVVLLAVVVPTGDGSSGAPSSLVPYTFVEVGRVLGPSDIGVPARDNTGTSDVSAIELPDGRIRIYFHRITNGPDSVVIASAISSDTLHFSIEPGIREPADRAPMEGFASPFVFQIPDGRYRLFYNGCQGTNGGPRCGIFSEISSDGLTFVRDPGLRLPRFSPYIQGEEPRCSAIVKLSDGRYRMYCSQQVTPNIAPNILGSGVSAIFSAVSSDLLNWTPEPGVRIGPAASSLTGDARHPTVVANSGGSVTLVYYSNPASGPGLPREMIATSKDGLTFDSETDTGIKGTEPSFVGLGNGSGLLYYGDGADPPTDGSTIHVARVFLNHLLIVTVHGHGSVASTPAGIRCPKTCTAAFPDDGKNVTLRATARRGAAFAQWSGACTGHGSCSFPMNADKTVGARFHSIPPCRSGERSTQKHPCRRK
jgi:hypothetical protein